MTAKQIERDERIEVIADLIRTSEGPVGASDICELTGKTMGSTLYTMSLVKQKHPQVKGLNGKGYIWEECAEPEIKEKVKTKPKAKEPETRYGDFKNDEGYPDPTAALALKMMEPKEAKIGVGEIWEVASQTPSFGNGCWLVLSSFEKGWVNCLEVYDPLKYAAPNSVHICFFEGDNKNLYVDTRRVTTKPTRYFEEYKGHVEDGFLNLVRTHIAEILCDQKEEVRLTVPATEGEAHAIVAKLEEKVGPPVDSMELALMKQKAEIYEKCFFAVANGRGCQT